MSSSFEYHPMSTRLSPTRERDRSSSTAASESTLASPPTDQQHRRHPGSPTLPHHHYQHCQLQSSNDLDSNTRAPTSFSNPSSSRSSIMHPFHDPNPSSSFNPNLNSPPYPHHHHHHQYHHRDDEDEDEELEEDDPFGFHGSRQASPQAPPSPLLPPPPRLMTVSTGNTPDVYHPLHRGFEPLSIHQSTHSLSPDPEDPSSSSISLNRPPSPLYPPHPPYVDSRDAHPLNPHRSPPEPRSGHPDYRFSSTTWITDSDRTIAHDYTPWAKSSKVVLLEKAEDEGEADNMGWPYPGGQSKTHATRIAGDHFQNLPSNTLPSKTPRRRTMLGLLAFLLLALIVAIAVVLGLRKSSSSPTGGSTMTAAGTKAKLWGVGGDRITTENGSTFIYNTTLGGTWVAIPFNDTAKCQDDSPPLNQPWDYSRRRIFGVNLGGWLVLEPFIVPYLFEQFNSDETTDKVPTVVDEWTLSSALGKNLASTLEEHYRTFVTEQDFAEIAAAGLNWIRIPVGWWMIETWEQEPMLAGVSFKYFLKAIKWARKYGLRINLDLHAVPGSQNGFNHSGRLGSINFLVGLMGVANAQRTLNYIRTLTQFISQPEYANVVPMFSVLNEPLVQKIGSPQIRAYYLQVYQMMRKITGFGQGKGPMMVIHDGFNGLGAGHTGWGGFLKGADRLGLDTHSYFAFDKQNNDSMGYNAYKPCTYWAKSFNQTNTDFGFNFAGEYSLAVNDCGLWLNNIGVGSRFDGTYPNLTSPDLKNFPAVGPCDVWKDYTTWNDTVKGQFADLAFSAQDAMQNSFFWTWKISHSIHSKTGVKPNPMWNYQLGLREGWIRPDARRSVGGCAIAAAKDGGTSPTQAWSGQFEDWQVGMKQGGEESYAIDPGELARYGQWPPSAIIMKQGEDPLYSNIENLPQYVPEGSVVVLKPEAPPDKSEYPAGTVVSTGGTGWANDADKAGWYVPAKDCQYPDPWAAGGLPQPTGPYCAGNSSAVSANATSTSSVSAPIPAPAPSSAPR